VADTPRERALGFLYSRTGPAREMRAGGFDDDDRLGAEAGAAALEAVGLVTPAERAGWRAALDDPEVGGARLPEAEALLTELLERVPPDDEGLGDELNLFEGAAAALDAIGAVDGMEWEERTGRHMSWPTDEEERAWNAGGTEAELLAVLRGPAEAVDGVRVLFALRFADGISFQIQREGSGGVWVGEEMPDLGTLRDDVGTRYSPGGSASGGHSEYMNFRTAPPPEASWVELTDIASTPIRVML
jgi:hypothetical protein